MSYKVEILDISDKSRKIKNIYQGMDVEGRKNIPKQHLIPQKDSVQRKQSQDFFNEHSALFYDIHFIDHPYRHSLSAILRVLPKDTNKSILDVGCGARGSLEWADMAARRVGLDPPAADYVELEGKAHKMEYVTGYCEEIPFPDEYFDVVCSFNSFDHLDDLDASIKEIKRVTAPSGTFLLITDVHQKPTLREPQVFDWDIVEQFAPQFETIDEKHFEKGDRRGIYGGVSAGTPASQVHPWHRQHPFHSSPSVGRRLGSRCGPHASPLVTFSSGLSLHPREPVAFWRCAGPSGGGVCSFVRTSLAGFRLLQEPPLGADKSENLAGGEVTDQTGVLGI